uniref:CSON003651 protein n=1 Tax=Culicoides sonorensis TaxID=179676 RepID=A0A336L222_CULSO
MEVKLATDDPYEARLFDLFNSFQDKDKPGLDRDGLVKLCMNLELKNRGEALVNLLTARYKTDKNDNKWVVNFHDFRAALLQVLGEELNMTEETTMSKNSSDSLQLHKSFKEKMSVVETQSDPETSDREIKPKFVVGRKKYGRRSRPLENPLNDPTDEKSASTLTDSDEEDDDEKDYYESPTQTRSNQSKNKVKRSVSQSEMQETKRRRPITTSRLKRCASLPPQYKNDHAKNRIGKNRTVNQQPKIDVENLSINLQEIWTSISTDDDKNRLNININQLESVCIKLGLHNLGAQQAAHEAFEKLSIPTNSTISYQQFVNLIQNDSNVLSSRENSMETVATITNTDSNKSSDEDRYCLSAITREAGCVNSDIIIEMWESAGVVSASALLVGLGFCGNEIQISELITTLEEEIQRSSDEKEILPFLKASLILHKAEVGALRHAFKQIIDENKKLYSNNKEMNRRAAILAQEVDERHLTIEKTTKNEIKILENRHTETIKQLTEQLTTERDQYTAINVRLENRIKNLESEENKLKAELSSLLEENSTLDSEKCDLQNQITDLYEQNIKLNQEIAELEDLKSMELKKEKENEEILELMDKVSSLQIENSNLRDKNDELTTEIEGLNIELTRYKSRKAMSEMALEQQSNNQDEGISGSIDQEMNGTGAMKRRMDSPSKIRISEESPRQGKLRKCNNETSNVGNESETSGEWMALNTELNNSISNTPSTSGFSQGTESSLSDPDYVKLLKLKVNELQSRLEAIPKDQNDWVKQNEKLKERCQDLEASLEQMRKEYEDCEDYWQNKLAEERLLYEEEQRQSDDKFTELLSKMSEYEDQFASATEKDGKLSPIAENSMLEQQYLALEQEMEELTEKARSAIEERDKQIEELKLKVSRNNHLIKDKNYSPPTPPRIDTPDSPASSTISYLFWNQSTIHGPARDYQNPVFNNNQKPQNPEGISFKEEEDANKRKSISPIQKPVKVEQGDECDAVSTKSVATTHSVHHSTRSSSPINYNDIQLKEKNLKEEVEMLVYQRDSLISELQQLQEAKPILAQAYTHTPHPNLSNRIQYLEQKNKHLQNVLKQQQQYMETVMHQAWQQQRFEIVELRNRLEAQTVVITEQAQRLANADLLAKDLFVENSHLTAAIQRLEQQRTRQALLQLSQHLPHLQQQGLGHLP